MPSVTNELQQAPLPEMIERLGTAIANAQFALDRTTMTLAEQLTNPELGVTIGGEQRTLLELGFTPTFYSLTEATIEVRVAFTASESQEFSLGATVGVNLGYFAATVNASYAAKYSFSASGSSAITARFVSVPAPAVFTEVLRSSLPRR
jgi:hypothetical protein